MAETHIYTVGLGEVRKVAPRNRAGKAMKILKEHVRRHANAESVSVSNAVNERIWANGARNPPRSLEVQVATEEGTAHVELSDRDLELPAEEDAAEPEPAAEELSDEEIAEMNVDEVQELVEDGAVDAQRALDIEYAGKNRKTLIEWLQDRVGSDEETAEEEEVAEESDEPAEDETEEPDEEEESGEETYDLPDDVVETFRDGTIDEGKDAARDLGKDAFEKLLNFEEAHQNRKGMKKFLRSNMN